MSRFFATSLVFVFAWAAIACSAREAPSVTAETRASVPHDRSAFTQGLLFQNGRLFESTGQYGASRLRRVDIETGKVQVQTRLDARYFGEGLAAVDNTLYWLTWKSGRAFLYDADTLAPIGTRDYDGQGWGLAYDGTHLIMSDGSDTLRVLDPDDFSVVRRITVRNGEQPVDELNELEYIDGAIWANVWFADRILVIDPADGQVRRVIEAGSLRETLPSPSRAEAFNGIAYDDTTERLWVTGKYWPRMFEIAKPDTKKTRP